ncbi:DUF4129 domain-containing protein [Humibacter ginsenosidimutans]|uniref:DUF4129 domain-containing protein n=1 Tax=Humibacter ginsenosidimutans TaxID=2599293 RepID=A0A5B8M1J3_9MICO|nr:DUF4129 domain-containing protein [Humibacter ginsenosidimutans]QDZ13789.1 DUF4129 domain-containing protein [Humibacter ginsenosidimutans]
MSNGDGRRASRSSAVIGVAALGVVIIGGVLAAGPVRIGAAPWNPSPIPQGHYTLRPVTNVPNPAATQAATAGAVSSAVPKVLIVLAVLAALILAFLLWRALRRRTVRTAALPPRLGLQEVGPQSAVLEPDPDPAPAVSRGIARALEVLDEERAPGDAIVAAWLGLQKAAADSGVRRRDAETPGEYTARIVGRIGTDGDAATTLLRLYQDVRFGAHPVGPDDVKKARACLLRLRESWRSVPAQGAR